MRFPGPDTAEFRFPGPDRRAIAWPPAPTFAVLVLAEAVGVGTAGAVMSAVSLPAVSASGTGFATADFTASTAVLAAAAGTGTATAVYLPSEVDAEAVGVGVASAAVLPSVAAAVSASGTGTASATVYPVAPVAPAASGTGTAGASVTTRTAVAAAASGTGSATATVTVGHVYTNPDTFNRTDSASLGSDWRVDRNGSPKIATNRAQMQTMSNGDGRAGNWTSYQAGPASGQFATDNYEVELQLIAPVGNAATDNFTGVILAAADTFGGTGGTGVMCYCLVSTGSGCKIMTQTGIPVSSGISSGQTGQTQQATTATNIASTDLIRFRRSGNVFTLYRNGSSLLTWTDASNIVSSGATNRRWGLIFEGNYPLFNAEFRSPAGDAVTSARDL